MKRKDCAENLEKTFCIKYNIIYNIRIVCSDPQKKNMRIVHGLNT